MSQSPALEDKVNLQAFSVSLAVYSKVKKTAQGKMTSKEEKSTKTKELLFTPDDSNYLEFLHSILHKHSLMNYQVTEKKHFSLKYILLKVKGQWIGDAINVDNQNDYREMVKKVFDEAIPVVKVFVNMQQVEKLPWVLQAAGSGSGNNSEHTTDGDTESPTHKKKADLDQRLARWHLKLEKTYRNEHDEGLTYVGPLGAIPLTPTMICDWCLALEDGQAMISVPPNIPSFDPANKALALHPARKAPVHSLLPSVDVNSLTSVLLLQMLTQSSLLTSQLAAVLSSTIPHTSTRCQEATASSPPIPSPLQLTRFLQIGPDILQDVDDKFLSDLGVSAGDVIHLKKGSTAWWNGPDAKCKRSDMSASASAPETQGSLPKKQVSYNKHYHDGGGCCFSGPPMQKDDNDASEPPVCDYDLFYFCDTQKQWLPVLAGYVVGKEEEDQ
ncbi:hypothetical protein EDC04DRAFT_2909211 [Pisolithus marmoratus]|nr:hypothetical protein EDC04DRAFT_2909211 [Pisolithus marmoratus]